MLPSIMFACALFAQLASDRPQADRWRGLVLGQSTVDDALRLLGQPERDKTDRLLIYAAGKWFEPGLNKKTLRKQSWKKVEGFDRVDLCYKGDKLVVIHLDFDKELPPTALANIYGLEFAPFVDALAESMFPRDFERHKGKVYPKRYPPFYTLVAVAPSAVITAGVNASSLGRVLQTSMGVGDVAGGGFPGKVSQVQLISRLLENRAGEDLLR